VKRFALPIAAAVVMGTFWAICASRLPQVLLPSPLEVAVAGWAGRGQLLEATGVTALASVGGLAIASFFGVGGAVCFQRWKPLEVALYPYALLIQTLPVVAIAPLLVVWLGYGLPVAVGVAAICAFFPILTSMNMGLSATETGQVELVRLHGAGWWQEMRIVRIPGALPYLFSGLRTAVGLSVIGAIVGEFVGSNGQPVSLGYVLLRAARSAETDLSFGAMFCATGLALSAFGVVRLMERRAVGVWHAG
jgi:NitT/TauT family transport system permease protein